MPYRKNHHATVARIEVNSFADFIELGDKIAVREHYALWLAGCARSEDNRCQIIPFALIDFFFDFAGICFVVFFAVCDNFFK